MSTVNIRDTRSARIPPIALVDPELLRTLGNPDRNAIARQIGTGSTEEVRCARSLPYGAIAVRTHVAPATLIGPIRERLDHLDPGIPLTEFHDRRARRAVAGRAAPLHAAVDGVRVPLRAVAPQPDRAPTEGADLSVVIRALSRRPADEHRVRPLPKLDGGHQPR